MFIENKMIVCTKLSKYCNNPKEFKFLDIVLMYSAVMHMYITSILI